jgi:acyl-CoA thioesterase-1
MRHTFHLIVIFTALLGALFGLASARADDVRNTDPYRLVMLGDSLTAGFNLPDEASLPAALERALAARGFGHVQVINAGVSGDTTDAGLARFDFSIEPEADGVLLALGANDALQGRSPEQAQTNLSAMIDRALERDLDLILVGMLAPLNMGLDYRTRFDGLYPALAELYDLPLYPFLLAPVALEPELLMTDGLHPTAEGVEIVADPLADYLVEHLFGQP